MNAVPKPDRQPMMWWAVQYARAGWAVHPLKPGAKTPFLKDWQNQASKDPARVREMWAQYPRANIGVHCRKSGVVVIDVDPRNGGDATLRRLEGRHGALWDLECLEARTAGGGRHFVFAAPDGVSLPHSLGDGVDLLHGNHYFIVAPSIGPSGNAYEWVAGLGPFDREGGE